MPNEDQPAIVLDGAAVDSGGGFALGPLDAAIPSGWTTAIVGANGSGKSTLFRMLLGLAPLAQGKLEVLGTQVRPGGDERYKARIGFVSENGHSWERPMTVMDKAAFVATWYPDWDPQYYRRLVRQFGIDEKAKLGKLSKGMQRKAELAVAMAHRPDLLLLDEPSSGLDPMIWKVWLEELQAYLANGDKTLLIATHITEEVRRLADHVLFLHRGRILAHYEKDRLFDEWRELLIQGNDGTAEAEAAVRLLEETPGVCRAERDGPGLYRVQVSGAGEAGRVASRLDACGFRTLESRRMELEDILSCMIQKEDKNREPA